MKNILLIRLKAIGDVIFTLPAVAVLREHYPEAKISFLASKENAPLLQGFRDINQVIALDRAALKKGNPLAMSLEFLGLLRRLRAGRFSLVVDFQGFGKRLGCPGSPARPNAGAASMAGADAGPTPAASAATTASIRPTGICKCSRSAA